MRQLSSIGYSRKSGKQFVGEILGGGRLSPINPANQQTRMPSVDFSLPFLDVPPSDWFYNGLVWAYDNGIAFVCPGGTFKPQSQVPQAPIVTDGLLVS